LTDVHYFVVSGFIIDGLGLATRCVGIEEPSTGIRVEYNEIKGSAFSAVSIFTDGTELVDNYIHDGGYSEVEAEYGYGIYVTGSGNLIEGNEVYNMGGYGMLFYSQTGRLHDNIITDNRIHHNNQVFDRAGAGMLLGGQNNLVSNNLIYDENNGYGIRVDYSDSENNKIVSNTIQNVAGYCLAIGIDSSAQGTILTDNTLDGCGYGPIYPFGTEY